MMASTASATLENSIRPDDDRSVFSGNIRTAVGGTSLSLNSCSNCSSASPGGVLKKWRIYEMWIFLIRICSCGGGADTLIPCLEVEYDFCLLVPAIGNDCFSSRCTLWSWDCDRVGWTGSSPRTRNFAWRNCCEQKWLSVIRGRQKKRR